MIINNVGVVYEEEANEETMLEQVWIHALNYDELVL